MVSRPTKLTDAQRQLIIERRRGGATVTELVSAFGVTGTTIRKALGDLGRSFFADRERAIADRNQAIIERRKAGATVKELVDAFGVSPTIIRSVEWRPQSTKQLIIEKYGAGASIAELAQEFEVGEETILYVMGKSGQPPDRNQAIIERRKVGTTLPELAKEFGISRQRVFEIVKRDRLRKIQPIIERRKGVASQA